MKNKTNILITALPFYSLSHDIKKLFKKKNITYKFLQKNKDINDIDIENYDAIIAGVENYDKKVILKASRLKLISRVGIGTDSINLEFCKKQNIKVFKVKSPNEAVAEYSISAIISSLRNFPIMNYNLHNKIWKPELGKSLSESTVGIIGYGKIGKLIANYLLKLKVGKILVHDLRKFNKNKNIHFCNKKRIFEESDIVGLNISLNDKTHNYV